MKLVLKDSPPSNSHAYKLGAKKVEKLRAIRMKIRGSDSNPGTYSNRLYSKSRRV